MEDLISPYSTPENVISSVMETYPDKYSKIHNLFLALGFYLPTYDVYLWYCVSCYIVTRFKFFMYVCLDTLVDFHMTFQTAFTVIFLSSYSLLCPQ